MQRLLIFSCSVLAVAGCGKVFQPRDYPSPDVLLEVSESMYRRGKCRDAALGFQYLTQQLPARDTIAVRARFLLAECHFSKAEFLEAARQFRRVANEAPGHPLAPRALLRSGDAQAKLWTNAELDPTHGEAARITYQEVAARYPRTPVARRANLKLGVLAERFAEKEYKVGNYYFRLNANSPAIIYYQTVIRDYGSTSYAPLALIRMVEAYTRLAYEEEKTETCDNLRRFYPDAPRLDEVCPVEGGGGMP